MLLAEIALFGDKLRARFFPPQLELTIRSMEGEKTTLTNLDGQFLDDTRYYYILVSNSRRWSPAENTQVFLTRLEEPGPRGDLQVRWFGDTQLRWRNQEIVPLLRTIGPDADCDFCRVEKKGILMPIPLVAANNLPTRWSGGCDFVVTLEARSNFADSKPLRVRAAWNGRWNDGVEEMKQNIQIKEA